MTKTVKKVFSSLTEKELQVFKSLNTPAKIQDFLETLPINFEEKGETCFSPRQVLKHKKAHCFEGAFFAAAVLMFHGKKPLLLDLVSAFEDDDHIAALFKNGGYWGAITKTNHGVLRYREPVYLTVRELAMSFFHEYFLNNGKKTLRAFSKPFDLSKFNNQSWVTSDNDLFYIARAIDDSPHEKILTQNQIRKLRKADPIEIKMGKITQWRLKKERVYKS